MAKTTYRKKMKNGTEYYFFRLRHKNLKTPRDLYGDTVKELTGKIKELTNELDHNITTSSKEYFGAFMKVWLYNTHMIDKKPSTKEKYDGIYRNYIEGRSIYSLSLKDMNAADIQSYYNALVIEGKSEAIVKNLHKIIAPCIRYAYDNNMILKDFSHALVIPKDKKLIKTNDIIQPFTLEQQKKFTECIKGHELESLFITALYTGMRQGELLALTWDDINFNKRTITINKTFKMVKNINTGAYEHILQPPKTSSGMRTISVPSFLINILKQHKHIQQERRIELANLYNDKSLVFCTKFGNYYNSSNILKRFKKIITANDLGNRKFHDLRHTFATRLFEIGESPKTVQTILGHSNISITLDTYTHVLENTKKEVATKLDTMYENMRI